MIREDYVARQNEIIEEAYDELEEMLDNMSDGELFEVHNEWCEEMHYYEDRIEYYEYLDELCYNMKPTEIIEKFGDLQNCSSDYIKFTIYGAEEADSSDVDTRAIAEYCIDNDEYFFSRDIELFLDDLNDKLTELEEEYEEEEEEEE